MLQAGGALSVPVLISSTDLLTFIAGHTWRELENEIPRNFFYNFNQ